MISVKVNCSSGTYVRSLAYDIGNILGTGATIKELKRTRIGDYSLEDSIDVEKFIKNIHKETDENSKNKYIESCPCILSVDRISEGMDNIYIEGKYRNHIINGWPITDVMIKKDRAADAGSFKKGNFAGIRDYRGKLLAVHEIICEKSFPEIEHTGRKRPKLTRSVITLSNRSGG